MLTAYGAVLRQSWKENTEREMEWLAISEDDDLEEPVSI